MNPGLQHHASAQGVASFDAFDRLRAEAETDEPEARPADAETRLEAVRGLLEETRSRMHVVQDELAATESRITGLHERAREADRAHREEIRVLKAELAKCGAHVDELAEELRSLKSTRLWKLGTVWWNFKARLRGGARTVG